MREDLYFDRGFKERKGSCRLIRKGTNQKYIPSLEEDDAVRIDGLSHKETAEIFNRCETFHCHDPYTAYSVFAVFCGCTTIVYPETGVSEADWRPIEERWGIAYGNSPEQIAFAQSTRHKMRETRARLQAEEDEQLRYFVTRLAERFD
uniref:Uncharacterized protein n=1 Tax=Candidatus Kentrum sp. DK TaxID=2126562 RepID=A0A450T5P4_9GAMM|nr:MAG: hypothetical protein BECKDK2373C_GA0170839_109321 [Candidatus Kentron sp. DK]